MNKRTRSWIVLGLAAAALAACQTNSAPEQGLDATVKISGGSILRTVSPGLIFGANFGAWVSETKLGAATRDLVLALRPSVGRFPGGNMANNYCWVTQKVSGNDHLVWEDWSWGTDVHEFLAFLKTIGSVPMFSVNPFDHAIDGVPHSAVSEADALARLFVAEGFSGAYYEIGNENDGSWNPMLSIGDYTDRFILLARAVKAVDPAARTMGPVVSSYDMTWIRGFLDRLAALGAKDFLDWISYHHYGGWISNGNANGINLDDPQALADELASIRGELDGRGLARVKIAVNELNAAIWDTGCTRDQFTIKQGMWLADALGVALVGADAANVWIHLHPGTDPHALIDSEGSPPAPAKNYWPVALAAQTLSAADPAAAVEVLGVDVDLASSALTAYAARKAGGAGLGVLLVNKTDRALAIEVELPSIPRNASGRVIGADEYAAGSGPAGLTVAVEAQRLTLTLPATSIAGLEIR